MSTAFVTGGTGFIGSHTVESLIKQGVQVRALVRPHKKSQSWISNLPIESVEGDLLDPATIEPALSDVDYVIHIAGITKAKRREDFFRGNVVATRNLLQLASRVHSLKKFCYISSLTVAGPSPTGVPFDENTPFNPISTYAESKAEAEQVCLEFKDSVPIVILRPPTVYGPRDNDFFQFFRVARYGIQANVGSKFKTLSLIYSNDLADAIVEATLSPKTGGKTYFVADPVLYEQSKLSEMIAKLVDVKPFRINLPGFVVYSVAAITQAISFFGPHPAVLNIEKARDILQDHWVCSPQKLKEEIDFSAKTSADEGLRLTYDWYKENKWI